MNKSFLVLCVLSPLFFSFSAFAKPCKAVLNCRVRFGSLPISDFDLDCENTAHQGLVHKEGANSLRFVVNYNPEHEIVTATIRSCKNNASGMFCTSIGSVDSHLTNAFDLQMDRPAVSQHLELQCHNQKNRD